MEKITESNQFIIYIVLFVFAFGLSWILATFTERSKKQEESKKKSKGMINWLFSIVIFLLIALAIIVFAFNNAYTAFTKEEIIATVECRPHRGADADFDVYLTRIIDGEAQPPQIFQIKGDQWELGGDILIWESYMNFIGLNSMYRLNRINGRYVRAKDEQSKAQSAYDLATTDQNDFWEKLYENATLIPIIDSVFTQSVASYPFYGDLFQITVTIGGYKAERLNTHTR